MIGSYGNRMGELCGAKTAPVIRGRLRNNAMVATRVIVAEPGNEKTAPLGIEDAFIAAVTFQEGYYRDNWLDGKAMPYQPPQPAGSVSLMDLRRTNETRFKSAVNSVQFYFPRTALSQIAEANDLSRVDELASDLSMLFCEPILAQLARSLIPAFKNPEETNQVFLDHVMMAAAIRLLTAHGGAARTIARSRGGLAPWQQKRVLDFLNENLGGEIRLNQLAELCGLSTRHFTRAFTHSNGMPPHTWILKRRVDRAKDLLLSTDAPLEEVARKTFFATQSHFTRVFAQHVGLSPGVWRRERRL